MLKLSLTSWPLLLVLVCSAHVDLHGREHDAVVDLLSKNISISGGKLIEKNLIEITINNRRGETHTWFYINYSKKEKIKNINAWIECPNGQVVRKLSAKEITTSSAVSDFSLYEDDFIKYFTLRHNTYPYKIHFEYTRETSDFIHIADWTPIYNIKIPTQQAELTVDLPEDFEVQIFEQFVEKPAATNTSERVMYSWNSGYKSLIEYELYAPHLSTLIPKVTIVPKNFRYGIPGSFESWQTFGEWQTKLLSGLHDLPPHEKMQINAILKNTSSQTETVELIYKYLQKNTRYINVSIGIGGLKPYPASYVSQNKYGDCKALTNYMVALLAYAGIKGYYTIVQADDEIEPLIRDFPSMQANHVICFIPLENDTLWLECTKKSVPANYLGTFTQGRYAFVVDGAGSKFVQTPALTEPEVRNISVYTYHLSTLSACTVEIQKCLRGSGYELFLELSKEFNKQKQEEYIRENISSADFELLSWEIGQSNTRLPEINLNIDMKISGVLQKFNSEYIVKPLPLPLPKFETLAKRKLDLVFNYPVSMADTLRYISSNNLSFSIVPGPVSIETKYGSYKTIVTETGNLLEISRSLVIHAGHYPVEEYKAFYAFIQDIRDAENKNVIVLK
ncbi:MAG: DUF3857 domain-containing protein [Bacteroidales bacterium]|nr:DUF3857 domain-containing protein [Bacteroidales bacterium]